MPQLNWMSYLLFDRQAKKSGITGSAKSRIAFMGALTDFKNPVSIMSPLMILKAEKAKLDLENQNKNLIAQLKPTPTPTPT